MVDRLLTAREAAALLGVRLPTLYAYASRGKLRSQSAPGSGRARLYAESEVRRLLRASQARAGHAAAAEGALDWGQPVLSSSITEITDAGPCYRGVPFSELIARGASFEAACEFLWYGTGSGEGSQWQAVALPKATRLTPWLRRIRQVPELSPLDALQLLVPWVGLEDPSSHGATVEAERSRGRRLITLLAACLGPALTRGGLAASLESQSIAARVLAGVAGQTGGRERDRRLLDAALVASLDHELNASTFCARVAASAGANLYASVSAGLGALSGPRHGRVCDRVEALIEETERPSRARALVDERARRGEQLPGFGHPLYPHGDPRGSVLLELARRHGRGRRLSVLLALTEAMVKSGRPGPTLDAGLVGVGFALGLPRGAGAGLFALGRAGGWIAHVLEQREQPELLRPRARYVGPPFRGLAFPD